MSKKDILSTMIPPSKPISIATEACMCLNQPFSRSRIVHLLCSAAIHLNVIYMARKDSVRKASRSIFGRRGVRSIPKFINARIEASE